MRTISIRLDDDTDTALAALCKLHGLTQTAAIKAALAQFAAQHRKTPGELAAEFGLIGSFDSGLGDLARNHKQRVRERLLAKRARDRVPIDVNAKVPGRRRAVPA
jgi:Ribbon-helix-helix protein, copG family